MSIRVDIVVEGQTEASFVNKVLCPYFYTRDINLIPRTVLTKADKKHGKQHKGGLGNYQKPKNDIEMCLRAAKVNALYVSTMFDFYRLPNDFPGYNEAMRLPDPYEKVAILEKSIKEDLCRNSPVFIPYLSLHEFEALLFSNVDIIDKHFFDKNTESLKTAVSEEENPELINGGDETAPSKRIIKCVRRYEKTKVSDGVEIARKIGLNVLREKCKHFNEWITKLDSL